MELQLKNIGMIKEANIKVDGLTVIAGENDTGKSAVGKALYVFLKFVNFIYNSFPEKAKNNKIIDENNFSPNEAIEYQNNKYSSDELFEHQMKHVIIFKDSIKGAQLKLTGKNIELAVKVDEDNFIVLDDDNSGDITKLDSTVPIFIESPLIWNFTDFFRDIAQIESQFELKLDYPYLMKDLNFKLHIKNADNGLDIKKRMTDLMGGEFKKDEMGRYYFDKKGQRVELVNTATGIKQFGIFQVLSQNNYLNKDTVLILDEPEVHLHPKWQLEMAKIIVELVKNGVKVLVNSHSPYMIEALKRYSEVEKIEDKTNFYLAENGYIEHQESLEGIFEKLALPMRELKKLKMDRYLND